MSEHLGEEFIAIRPDARAFRAELQAQISAALGGVQQQIATAQRNVAGTRVTPAGIVLPAGVRSVEQATKDLGATTKATQAQLQKLTRTSQAGSAPQHTLSQSLRSVERDAGRYTRGMVAATVASTGFFRAVSFASGAFLVGAAVGATVGAAIQEFGDMTRIAAQTNAVLKATGGSANVTAPQIDALATSVLNLTGVDDELVKSAANILLCLEESAEALTRDRGWVLHDDLKVGDEILAYDPDDDTTRWEPVLDIYRYHHVTELVRWQSKQIDVATTPHHRWWSTARTTLGREKLAAMQDYRFRTTEEITGHQFAVKIGGGSPGCFREEAVYSDDLVELAAWVFTEGAFTKAVDQTGRSAERRRRLGIPEERPCSRCDEGITPRRRGPAVCDACRTPKAALQTARRQMASALEQKTEGVSRHYHVTFCQSETANPENVDRIRALLERLRGQGHVIGEHSYIAPYNRSQLIRWDFARDLGQALRMLLPQKKLTPAFLNNLTAEQARLFLDVLILGDGSVDKAGHAQFIQKDQGQLDLVAMLAGMLGIRTSRLGRGDAIYFCVTNHLWGHAVNAKIERYDGVVWCPQIRTQIFFARNRGRTFWTGNTFRAIRNEVGAGNDIFNRATKAVVDISSVFKTDLRGSAVQLGKALQDPVRGVTALRRSGITLTQGQRELIKRLVQTGGVLAAQRVILGEVDRQVGRTAESIGRTLPGRLAILRERAKNSLGEYVKRVTESKQATELFTSASTALSQTFNAIKASVQTVSPVVLGFTQALFKLTQLIGGAGTLIAVAAAFKAVKIAIAAAAIAQGIYTKAVLVGTGAITAQEAALLASAGAFRGKTAAALAGTTIKAGTARVAIGEVGAVSGLAAARVGILGAALSALKGPLGIAIGIGVVTAALIKLSRASQGAGTVADSLKPLAQAIRDAQGSQTAVAGRREDISIARFDQAAAIRDVERAQNALNRSTAGDDSPQRLHLINQLRNANQRLTDATNDLAEAQRLLDEQLGKQDAARKKRQDEAIAAQDKLARAIQFTLSQSARGTAAGGFASVTATASRAQTQFVNLRKALDDMAGSGDRLTSTVGSALRAIQTSLNAIPTEKQIQFVLSSAVEGKNTQQILTALGILSPGGVGAPEGKRLEAPLGIAGAEAQFQLLRANEKAARDLFIKVRDIAAERRGELATQREQVTAAHEARDAARESLAQAVRGLRDARQQLAESQRSLIDTIQRANQAVADAIRQGRQSVNDAVRESKRNLDDLGQSIAEALGKFADAGGAVSAKLGPRFKALRDQIIKGGGGPETQRAAQQISFQLQAQTPSISSDKIQQQFADLTDSLNRGTITLPKFTARLHTLLRGLDINEFRKQFGSAAANLLLEQINAIRTQANLVFTAPKRPGGGIAQELVRPLEAVKQASKDIATARREAARDIADSKRDLTRSVESFKDAENAIVRANKDLREAEADLIKEGNKQTRLNTAATRANTRSHNALVKYLAERDKRLGIGGTKDKPKGGSGAVVGGLAEHGALNP